MTHFKLGGLAAAVAFATAIQAAAPISAAAQDTTLALPTTTLLFVPAYVAEEKGFWKDQGLNVKSIVVAGPGATNAVLAGSADFTMSGPGPMFRAIIGGQKLTAIGNTANRLLLEAVVRQDVAAKLNLPANADEATRAKALKGLTLGVDSVNGFAHIYMRYIAGKFGMDTEKDFTVSPMQPPAMVSAIKAKAVDGFVFSQPFTLMAVKEAGAVTLFSSPRGDLPEMQPYAYNMLIARGDFCPAKPDLCRKFMAGINAAQGFIKKHPEETVALLQKKFDRLDPTLVKEAFAVLAPTMPASAEVEEAGLKNAMDFSITGGLIAEKDRIADLKAIYTNAYLK